MRQKNKQGNKMLRSLIASDGSIMFESPPMDFNPRIPQQLFGEILIAGEIRLSWNRNGNPWGTDYIVEAQVSNSTRWIEIYRTDKPSFLYVGHRSGIPIKFRIIAELGDKQSLPSNIFEINYGFQLFY